MLRRPFSTVLSSVSIRNLLSTRLCSVPLTSTDDQITTVQTTGLYWMKNDKHRTSIGNFWGENDPRNKIEEKSEVPSTRNGLQAKLRSIIIALKQAKKDGLKRIRVQTDFRVNEPDYRRAIENLKNGSQALRDAYARQMYEQISMYMDEIEVIMEYRTPYIGESGGQNELLEKLWQEKKLLSHDFFQCNFIESLATITPKNALPLEGRIVPTVYAVGTIQTGFCEGTYAMLWVPESIDTLDIKPRSRGSNYYPTKIRLTRFQAMLVAIESAIKEAQSLNIPEIQVITNSIKFIEFFKNDWQSIDGGFLPNEDIYHKMMTLLEKTKVHFKTKELTEDNDDAMLIQAYEMANDKRLSFLPPASTDDQITTVRTTGLWYTVNGIIETRKGVYWGEGDSRNVKRGRRFDTADLNETQLRTIVMTLKQARNDGIKRLRIQTDFKMEDPDYRRTMLNFKNSDFMMLDGTPVPYSEYYKLILWYMDEMEVTIEYRTPYVLHEGDNEVMRLLGEEEKRENPDYTPCNFTSSDWIITPKDALPLEGRVVPTVYAVVELPERKSEEYATLWMTESIDRLEMKPRSLGSSERPSGVPLTLFQASLVAIHDAIKEAQSLNIPEILVITNSIHFIEFFKKDWKKNNRGSRPNVILYDEIKALTETTKVHFKGVKLTEDDNEELLGKLDEMAKKLEKQPNNPLLDRLDDHPFWNKKPQPDVV